MSRRRPDGPAGWRRRSRRLGSLVIVAMVTGWSPFPVAAPVEGRGVAGRPLSPTEVAADEPLVYYDGRGLPPGCGTAMRGAVLYRERCQSCHGIDGRGGHGGDLAGGDPDLTRTDADRVIGTYWPYAPPLFDFIRRAMPMNAPRSLDDPDVYALTAYLLALNGVVPPDAALDARSLATVRMPNRDGFVGIDARWPGSPAAAGSMATGVPACTNERGMPGSAP
mgnify:CR=1 FL=1